MLPLKRLLLLLSILATFTTFPLHAAVNILLRGAKGDCITNDAPVINATIQEMAFRNGSIHSGAIYFPTPPGGCYLVNDSIILPAPANEQFNVAITLSGDGRGVSVIKAGRAIDSVLEKDANWNRGDTITDITFDANGLAKHAISVLGGIELRFTRIEGLNATVDDLHFGGVANYFGGESFVTDSMFANYTTFPPYNIFIDSELTDNEFTNDVEINAKTANIDDGTSSANHFTANHAYGWPLQYCPEYSFISGGSYWIGNQSDCSNTSAFLLESWNAIVQSNYMGGVNNHAVCISPQVGSNVVTGNIAAFNNANESASDSVVQGVMQGKEVICTGPGVHTATWGDSQNFDIGNIVNNNWPESNENLWDLLYTSPVNQAPALGVGTPNPHATLDINGFARLNANSSEPAACTAANRGAIALNSASRICTCNGEAWKLDSNGQACVW